MSCYFVQCINVLLYKTCLKRPSQSGAVAAPGSRGRCCSSDAPLRLKRNSRRNKWRLSSAQQLISDRARQQEPLRGKHTAPGFLRSEDELRISRRTSPGRGALAEIVGEGGGPNPAKTPPNPPAVADGRRCLCSTGAPIIRAVGDRSRSNVSTPPLLEGHGSSHGHHPFPAVFRLRLTAWPPLR